MDFTSSGFIIAIVLASGLIAYVADILGKKLGKQRRSLWGLRPRHTAAVFTVAFGMLVSLATMTLVGVVSAPVRRWMFYGSQALSDLNKTRDQLSEDQSKLSSAELNLRKTREEENTLKLTGEGLQKEIRDSKITLDTQKGQITDAKTRIESLNKEISSKDAKLALNEKALKENEANLLRVSASLHTATTSLTASRNDYNKEIQRAEGLFEKNTGLEEKNSSLSASIGLEHKELSSLTTQKESLEKTNADLQVDLGKASKQLTEVKSVLADETENLTKAQAAQAQYAEFNFQLQKDFVQTRLQPMIYRRFQEVTRLPVDAELTSSQADEAIDTILQKARMDASARGARATGKFKVADIIDLPDGTTADKIKKDLHDAIVGKPEPLVLIAVASLNFYEHEPIIVEIHPSPNPIVYHRGQVVDQTELHGNEPDTEIIRELTAFGATIRDKAQRDKMIPRSNGEAFGSVPADQVLSIINQVKQTGRVVRLQAIVQNETRAADPLKIDFKLQ